MRKRLTALQEKRINQAKETFGSTLFVTSQEIARLRYPNDFPTNMARLCSDLTQRARLALHVIITLMQLMPEKYVAEILTSKEFDNFMFRVMQQMEAVDKKKPDAKVTTASNDSIEANAEQDEQSPYSFRIAAVMLNQSLVNIIKAMPEQFHESLKLQIYPFLTLVNAVANFSETSHVRKKSPRLFVPSGLMPSSMVNASNTMSR